MLGSGLIHLGWTYIRFRSYIPRVQELHTWGRLSLCLELGMNEIRLRTKSLGVDLY